MADLQVCLLYTSTECGKNHTRYLFWCAAHTEVDGHADKHDPWNTE